MKKSSGHLPVLTTITLALLGLWGIAAISGAGDQASLTPFIIVLGLAAAVASCRFLASRNGRMDWFHPSVLVSSTFAVYIIFPATWLLVAHDFQPLWLVGEISFPFWANTTLVVGSVSLMLFTVGWLAGPRSTRHAIQVDTFRRANWRYVVVLLFIIGAVAKGYHLSQLGASFTLDALQNLSPTFRRENKTDISFLVLVFGSMLDWAFLLMVFRLIVDKSSGKFFLLVTAILGGLVLVADYYISGKRTAVLALLLLPLIWRYYLVETRLRTLLFVVVAMLVGAGILLLTRIALPLVAQGLSPADYLGSSASEIFSFYFDSPEWATFEMAVASLTRRDELVSTMGGELSGFLKYNFSTLVVFIPRAIWPDKPVYEDLSQVYYREIWGVSESVGMAPTLWGASQLFLPVAGVAVAMVALGWISAYATKGIAPGGRNLRSAFLYGIFLWMLFQYLRFGTMGFVLLYFIQAMLIGLMCSALIFKRSR